MTSIKSGAGPSAMEYLIMLFDFVMILNFNLYFIRSYKLFKLYKEASILNNFEHLLIKSNCIYQDKKNKIRLPAPLIINFTTTIKVFFAIMFRSYPNLFSICFIIFSILSAIFSIKKNKLDSLRITGVFLTLFYIFESLAHCGFALFNISKKFSDSELYQNYLLVVSCCWLIVGIFLMISGTIEAKIRRRKLLKKSRNDQLMAMDIQPNQKETKAQKKKLNKKSFQIKAKNRKPKWMIGRPPYSIRRKSNFKKMKNKMGIALQKPRKSGSNSQNEDLSIKNRISVRRSLLESFKFQKLSKKKIMDLVKKKAKLKDRTGKSNQKS
jgi:hypothetical protein